MSRTYRRKGYEDTQRTSWDRPGNKTFGYYTKRIYRWWAGSGTLFHTFHVPSKQEYFKMWYRTHGESRTNKERSPDRSYRIHRMKENRNINKQELFKWITQPDNYEPLFESNPRDCWWDWI
jgi:hypothetical protein